MEQALKRQEIESIAGFATFPLVPVLTVAAALRTNLTALSDSWRAAELPIKPTPMTEFGEFIGKAEIEAVERAFVR
jgi:methylisocitrate lyase